MMWSDGLLLEKRPFEPWDDALVQPASYEVRLAEGLVSQDGEALDGHTLYPGAFALASTIEEVRVPEDAAAQVGGKSSWARKGLLVHVTAGFLDPGFEGQITLELSNLGLRPLALTPGMRIAQVCFWSLDRAARKPYGHEDNGNHYQGQRGPTCAAS